MQTYAIPLKMFLRNCTSGSSQNYRTNERKFKSISCFNFPIKIISPLCNHNRCFLLGCKITYLKESGFGGAINLTSLDPRHAYV